MSKITIKKLNILPSKPDDRDHIYVGAKSKIADSIDLREYDSVIEDQGYLGSCVGNAICNAYEVLVKIKYPEKFKELSRLFVYYHSRFFDETLSTDTGSYLRDGIKAVKHYGVCNETLWPYDITKFDDQPPPPCYLDGAKRTITQYEILYTNSEIIEVLSAKKPVVVAIEVFSEFLSLTKDNNVVAVPNGYGYSLGLHAVTILGYNLAKQEFLIKNSWGSLWGDNGYAWVPFSYIENFAFERWCFDINNQNTIL